MIQWGWRTLGIACLVALALLGGYAGVPVEDGKPVTALSMAMFLCGVAAFSGAVTVLAVRRQRGTASGSTRLQVFGLLALIIGAVLFFAVTYFRLAKSPGQIAGLVTGVDALYFTVSTMLTVGFGDVHATGQLSRVVVIIQMIFTVTVLGVAAKLLSFSMKNRVGQSDR